MAEEVTLESFPGESYDAGDSESEEALAEMEDSAEDITERARRAAPRRRYFRAIRGTPPRVAVRGQDGVVRNVFPAKLATAAETNRSLATHELGRKALEDRLDRLDTRMRAQQRKEHGVAGLVTLLIGGGLTAWGIIEASKLASGSRFRGWADQRVTEMAAVASASHLATTGARLALDGRYPRNGIRIAADAFATSQLTAFLFGKFRNPNDKIPIKDLETLKKATLEPNKLYATQTDGEVYETFQTSSGVAFAKLTS